MKPGPAMSIDSTQRSTAVLARSAAISSAATSRGFRFCALASGIAAVTARSPWSACLGVSKAAVKRVARADFGDRRAQRIEQFFTGRHHRSNSTRRISRLTPGNEKSLASVNKAGSAGRCTVTRPAPVQESRPRPAPFHVRRAVRPRPRRSLGRRPGVAVAHRQVPHPRSSRRRRDQRGLPRLRRLPAPERRDQAGALVDRRRPDRRPLFRALLRRRGGAGRQAAAPERGPDLRRRARPGRAVPGHGVRRRQHAAPVLPRRPAALARADRRDRLQVRDGARLRLPPGADPSRRQAGEPAGRAHQRHHHRRQDHRLRQRAEPRLGRDPDPPRRLARLHVAGAARRRDARLPRRHVLARRRALSPDRRPAAVRCAGAVGHDASDLQRQAGVAGRRARRRHRGARRRDPEGARQAARPALRRLGRVRAARSRRWSRPSRCRAASSRACSTRSASRCCARSSSSPTSATSSCGRWCIAPSGSASTSAMRSIARARKATASTSWRRARSRSSATARRWRSSVPAPRSARWPISRRAPS